MSADRWTWASTCRSRWRCWSPHLSAASRSSPTGSPNRGAVELDLSRRDPGPPYQEWCGHSGCCDHVVVLVVVSYVVVGLASHWLRLPRLLALCDGGELTALLMCWR